MKFANLMIDGQACPCIQTDKGFIDIVKSAKAIGDKVPSTMETIIANGVTTRTESGANLLESLERIEFAAEKGSVPTIPVDAAVYAPAVTAPGKILCVGLNYAEHVEECHGLEDKPEFPVIFSKFTNTLAANEEIIKLEDWATEYDYESELVVIIGRRAKGVSIEDAAEYIFGYTVGNDFTARDLQRRTGQWLLGKSCDHFAPLGPVIVTANTIDVSSLSISCAVNGEMRQSDTTSNMIYPCANLVSYISTYITLEPGDIIFTGTPSGVMLGYPDDQKDWLKAGDIVECTIEGIGTLRNIMG